jgi:PAS domain S-box-containing protein/putative nucleotidyltransferase with HDIG domain
MHPDSYCNEIFCKQLLDELDDAILIINQEDAIVESNKTACELYGYSNQELRKMQLKDLLAPNVSLFSSSSPLSCKNPTTWHCNKDGIPFFVELLERPLQSINQSNLSLVRIRNISLAHLSEQQRQRDYQIYKAVVEGSPLLIVRLLPDTTITFANMAFCNYFGHTRKDILGKKVYEFPPDQETRGFLIAHFGELAKNPRTITHDNIVIACAGQPRWVQFTDSPIFDSSGDLHEIQSVGIDIHEQKLAEIKVQQNEAKYRAIMDQSNEGIVLLDVPTGKIIEANRKACELFNYTSEEMLLRFDRELTTESRETIQQEETELYQNSSLPLKSIHIITKEGRLIEVERLVKLLKIDDKDVALISLRDVSERKKINALLQKQAADLKHKVDQLQKAWSQTVDVLAAASEAKDPYTSGHQKRVAQLAVAIGHELALPDEQITALRMAALIHDIGKITVPAELLSKPGILSLLEYQLVQTHVTSSYNLLRALDLPWNIADVIHQHHERLDGSGYPNQLQEKQLYFKSKILAVADVVEAMSSHRPYRPARGVKSALAEIATGKGSLFDSDVVDACIKLFQDKNFTFDEADLDVATWSLTNRDLKT